jgi:phosphatidylinositol alpha 1,6-mannosyltransferase
VRIAVVSESFLPQVNGVSNTVRHLIEQLSSAGHRVLVVAPGQGCSSYAGHPVIRVRSLPLPRYRDFPVGLPDPALANALTSFAPDVVHLASPAVLGAAGMRVARRLAIPTVAVFQTDLAAFARQYRLRADTAVWAWIRHIHKRADRTLAPSTVATLRLRQAGVPRVYRWGRGVNLDLFGPEQRDQGVRHRLAPAGEVLIGYVGRVAAEKCVRRLVEISDIPGSRLVVVGDGPELPALQRLLPRAVFTGMLQGQELARVFASLDVFVHTGAHETFCQTVQEAQASGVTAVAPASGGPLDLIEHGRSGLLYSTAQPAALRETVTTAVNDQGLRRRLASRALDRVRGRTWSQVVAELVSEHYAGVLAPMEPAA